MAFIVCYRNLKNPGYIDSEPPGTYPIMVTKIDEYVDGAGDTTLTIEYEFVETDK